MRGRTAYVACFALFAACGGSQLSTSASAPAVPDPDNDRILAACDECPNDPESWNGSEDLDGCPDCSDVVAIACPEYNSFSFGVGPSLRFEGDSEMVFDEYANEVQEPSRFTIGLVGQAASTEPNAAELAQLRANFVRDLLVERGIDAARLSVFTQITAEDHAPPRSVNAYTMRDEGNEWYRWNGTEMVRAPGPVCTPPVVQRITLPPHGNEECMAR